MSPHASARTSSRPSVLSMTLAYSLTGWSVSTREKSSRSENGPCPLAAMSSLPSMPVKLAVSRNSNRLPTNSIDTDRSHSRHPQITAVVNSFRQRCPYQLIQLIHLNHLNQLLTLNNRNSLLLSGLLKNLSIRVTLSCSIPTYSQRQLR
jgi:hypothetical protein